MNFLKRGLYKLVKNDSALMGKIGEELNWDWLEQESKKNREDPSRALRKAAVTAASIYAGGALGGAAGGAGGAAGGVSGGTAGVGPVVSGTAYETAMQAAQQAAMQSAQQGATQGLLGYGGELASVGEANAMGGLLGGSQPANVGVAHNTAFDAIRNSGSLGEVGGSLKNWATSGYKSPFNASGGNGLLGGMDAKSAQMGMQGMGMLSPQEEQQRPMAPPPPPAQPMPPSDFQGYGMQGDPFAGMSEEQKRKLLAMLQQQGGMR